MAIETFGRISIAERANLAVIGVAIRVVVLFVAAAAIFQDGEPDRIGRRALDVVSRVAVRADGCASVTRRRLLAMHRVQIALQLIVVARPAHARNGLPPLGAAFGYLLMGDSLESR